MFSLCLYVLGERASLVGFLIAVALMLYGVGNFLSAIKAPPKTKVVEVEVGDFLKYHQREDF